MVPRERTFNALVEDMGSVSITHTVLTNTCNSICRGDPIPAYSGNRFTCDAQTYVQVLTHRYKIKITLKTMNAVLRSFI